MTLLPHADAPSSPTRTRAPRAGRLLKLLLASTVALTLAACDIHEPPPDGTSPPGTEQPGEPDPGDPDPGEPDPGEPDPGDEAPDPDLETVAIRLQPILAEDPASDPNVFAQPLGVVTDGATDLLYVMQKGGVVRRVDDGNVLPESFLDLSGDELMTSGESGLLGLAFHPDFDPDVPDDRFVFVHYTPVDDAAAGGMRTVVSRIPVNGEGLAVHEEEVELFTVPQPGDMHNGGQLAFGPDDLLYVALGEGDAKASPSFSRSTDNPHGAILRLDPEAEDDDYVAAGNPFADAPDAGDPYIWHYGLRNPWRFSFDPETGDMWIADVGEDHFEEINFVQAGTAGGLHFGWDVMEGTECTVVQEECDAIDPTPPLYVYPHPEGEDEGGRSITGGYVYYGTAIRDLVGAYVFADFMTGEVWAIATADDGEPIVRSLLETEHMISSLGVDANGELLVVDYLGGLHRIVSDTTE